ncbi:MAG: ROK family protein [Acidobacteriota bacterium]|jgi:glucokinase
MERIVLAADLGGTNLRMAAVNTNGEILYRSKVRTPSSGSRSDVIAAILTAARECMTKVEGDFAFAAFGAAVPAIVNSKEGIILRSPNLPELNGMEFSKVFSEALELPVILENDANSATVGENWLGAAVNIQNFIMVTLGTGVGGGIMVNGELLRGPDGTAGEVGHIAVEPDGHPCGCGSNGCLEQYASATAISRTASELIPVFPESSLHSDLDITPLDVYNAGLNGDALSIEVFRRVGRYLGIALGGLINVLNPEAIVIGGGAAAGWDLFIESLEREISYRAFQQPAERVRLRRSVLGDDAGLIGVARLASEAVIGQSRISQVRG